MKNKKGFTLVELLAVVVILGLMMGIAIPNIMGIIKKQKQSTYLEDGKKMVSRAEYMLRSTTKIEKPTNGNCVAMTLGYLDNGEFNSPPYGGAYFSTLSYVIVKNDGGKYKYWFQLYECQTPGDKNNTSEEGYTTTVSRECNNSSGTGIHLISSTDELLKKPGIVSDYYGMQFSLTSSPLAVTGCNNSNTQVYTADSTVPITGGEISNLNAKKDVIFDYND